MTNKLLILDLDTRIQGTILILDYLFWMPENALKYRTDVLRNSDYICVRLNSVFGCHFPFFLQHSRDN